MEAYWLVILFYAIYKINGIKTDDAMPHSFLDIEKCPDYTSGLYVRIIRPKIAQTLVQPIAQTLVQPIAQTLVQKGFSTGPLKNHQ
jgi:hypothetical protein